MARLIYSMITSLDGYVADADGDFGSWAQPDEEVLAALNDDIARVGTYLYGRRMYELMAVWESDPSLTADSPASEDFARLWQQADKVVYSTTLTQPVTERTRVHGVFDPEQVRTLKETSSADLSIDGPTLASAGLEHGLVDEIAMYICPVSLGGGLAFLPRQRLDLRLLEQRRFGNGVVRLRYAVRNGSR
ncbi:dihydrofolate reductase family protein [Pseudactinotalea sp. Z1739]|uniref:dihydrofolate reductase family protein n=1 Tax=Pseudactinotalea sp. Z1739 TaxID=3413028 RepID=UPI003C7AA263